MRRWWEYFTAFEYRAVVASTVIVNHVAVQGQDFGPGVARGLIYGGMAYSGRIGAGGATATSRPTLKILNALPQSTRSATTRWASSESELLDIFQELTRMDFELPGVPPDRPGAN